MIETKKKFLSNNVSAERIPENMKISEMINSSKSKDDTNIKEEVCFPIEIDKNEIKDICRVTRRKR
jgi:hypothetical protein